MIMAFQGKLPKIDPTVFIADSAMVIGDVEIGPGSNVWFQCVIRGDTHYIRIGSNCSIQDSCVLHVERNIYPLIIEDDVVLGHRVVAHACEIGEGSLIGIGAIVLNGAKVGKQSIVGAGSVVTPHSIVPPRTLVLGNPARPVRPLSEKDLDMVRGAITNYLSLKEIYRSLLGE
jgi:carbonic anhydrase/acetyltransferase-like protein (isoleucine patch superfamily)